MAKTRYDILLPYLLGGFTVDLFSVALYNDVFSRDRYKYYGLCLRGVSKSFYHPSSAQISDIVPLTILAKV